MTIKENKQPAAPCISVIVPVYNVEEYLPACLDALAKQDFADYELLLINDGSQDESGRIADAFAARDARVRVVHQTNEGIAAERNTGVCMARGQYIAFVDSDDLVTPDYLSYLYGLLLSHGADVAVAGHRKFSGDAPARPAEQPAAEREMRADEAIEALCYGKLGVYVWGKLFRREMLEGIKFPAGKLYEDVAVVYRVLSKAKRVVQSAHCVYYWRQRQGSITHQQITQAHWAGVEAVQQMEEYIRERHPAILPAAQYRCAVKVMVTAHRLVLGGGEKELFGRARQEMKKYLPALLRNPHAGASVRLRCLLLCAGRGPFSLAARLYAYLKHEE